MRLQYSPFRRGAVFSLTLLIAVTLTACGAPPKSRGLIDEIDDATMSEHELRARVTEFAREVMGHMKARSYKVYALAKDSESRRNALLAAIRSNESTIRAATHSDPVISLADLWALIVQIRQFVSRGDDNLINDTDVQIMGNIDRLEQGVLDIANDLGGPSFVAEAQAKIESWALENPISSDYYRPSVGPVLAASFKETAKGLSSVAQTLDDRLASISDRLEILNSQLPQQITWHAAMLVENSIGDLDIEEMAARTNRILTMVEQAPQSIEAQRDAVLDEINRQRTDTLGVVDTQRDLILGDFDRQRTETLAELQTTVDDTLSTILEVRDATFARIDATLVSTLDRLDGESESLVADIDAEDAGRHRSRLLAGPVARGSGARRRRCDRRMGAAQTPGPAVGPGRARLRGQGRLPGSAGHAPREGAAPSDRSSGFRRWRHRPGG